MGPWQILIPKLETICVYGKAMTPWLWKQLVDSLSGPCPEGQKDEFWEAVLWLAMNNLSIKLCPAELKLELPSGLVSTARTPREQLVKYGDQAAVLTLWLASCISHAVANT